MRFTERTPASRADIVRWDNHQPIRGIAVQLGGTLELAIAGDVDVTRQVGRTLKLFDWSGVSPSGKFEIRSPFVWDLHELYSIGEVTLVAVPEPSALLTMLVGVLVPVACCRATDIRWRR